MLLIEFTFLQADELVFEAVVQVPDRSVSYFIVLQGCKINKISGASSVCGALYSTALCLTKELFFGN